MTSFHSSHDDRASIEMPLMVRIAHPPLEKVLTLSTGTLRLFKHCVLHESKSKDLNC